ncbi:CHAD domain-containing protein [Catalinimonas alkaloidigena]|uniref:CHAD domain-containing protein n=1 Tax=Catalinimonas alkaloidigena TaxID=1075417 RepID=A0A1G9UBS9_9BACT|nr:CHAD domain-containing protein [Catalinimonas alkaloidigena]SDM57322.1 CHAD domain-containing protein [Catalinimonas alkaloidigena]
MSYRFHPHEPLATAIRRVTTEQLGKAQVALQHLDDPHESVHTLRKCMKKARAAARLVRSELGEASYHQANASFRDTAALLSETRDITALIDTLNRLRSHYRTSLHSAAFTRVRRSLYYQRNKATEHLTAGKLVPEALARLQAAQTLVNGWQWQDESFGAMAENIARTYQRGRKALAQAYDSGEAADFHEWRKRTKYLGYQFRLLRVVWPTVMKAYQHQWEQLGAWLGDDHDLAVLQQSVQAETLPFQDNASAELLLGILEREQARLRQLAYPLGKRLYHDKADRFVDRLACWWKMAQHAP